MATLSTGCPVRSDEGGHQKAGPPRKGSPDAGRQARGRPQPLPRFARVQAQAEEEAIAASTLDAETAAILQEKHDVDVALQIRAAEIRRRDADAAVTAAQNEGAGAEQKPPAIYVKRAAG